jgi:hypothetical protein
MLPIEITCYESIDTVTLKGGVNTMTKKVGKVGDGLPPATLNDGGKLSHFLLYQPHRRMIADLDLDLSPLLTLLLTSPMIIDLAVDH